MHNQLSELCEKIVIRFPAVIVYADEWDLCPHHNTVLVAQIIKKRCLLIVSKPYRIGSDFPDQRHILGVLFFGQSPAQIFPVLMPADTVQGIASSVQEEAFTGIDGKTAESKGSGDTVIGNGSHTGIEIRRFHAIPQHGMLYRQADLRFAINADCLARIHNVPKSV